jgi:hypothetical protein
MHYGSRKTPCCVLYRQLQSNVDCCLGWLDTLLVLYSLQQQPPPTHTQNTGDSAGELVFFFISQIDGAFGWQAIKAAQKKMSQSVTVIYSNPQHTAVPMDDSQPLDPLCFLH